MDDELTLTLRKPITIGTQTWTELHLTEPTAGQLIKAGKAATSLEQVAMLIGLNAKVVPAVVEQLAQRDFADAANFFGRFSDSSPALTPNNSAS
jgi:hypothetical protein